MLKVETECFPALTNLEIFEFLFFPTKANKLQGKLVRKLWKYHHKNPNFRPRNRVHDFQYNYSIMLHVKCLLIYLTNIGSKHGISWSLSNSYLKIIEHPRIKVKDVYCFGKFRTYNPKNKIWTQNLGLVHSSALLTSKFKLYYTL